MSSLTGKRRHQDDSTAIAGPSYTNRTCAIVVRSDNAESHRTRGHAGDAKGIRTPALASTVRDAGRYIMAPCVSSLRPSSDRRWTATCRTRATARQSTRSRPWLAPLCEEAGWSPRARTETAGLRVRFPANRDRDHQLVDHRSNALRRLCLQGTAALLCMALDLWCLRHGVAPAMSARDGRFTGGWLHCSPTEAFFPILCARARRHRGMERMTGFAPATSTLATLRSTNRAPSAWQPPPRPPPTVCTEQHASDGRQLEAALLRPNC